MCFLLLVVSRLQYVFFSTDEFVPLFKTAATAVRRTTLFTRSERRPDMVETLVEPLLRFVYHDFCATLFSEALELVHNSAAGEADAFILTLLKGVVALDTRTARFFVKYVYPQVAQHPNARVGLENKLKTAQRPLEALCQLALQVRVGLWRPWIAKQPTCSRIFFEKTYSTIAWKRLFYFSPFTSVPSRRDSSPRARRSSPSSSPCATATATHPGYVAADTRMHSYTRARHSSGPDHLSIHASVLTCPFSRPFPCLPQDGMLLTETSQCPHLARVCALVESVGAAAVSSLAGLNIDNFLLVFGWEVYKAFLGKSTPSLYISHISSRTHVSHLPHRPPQHTSSSRAACRPSARACWCST